MLKTWLREKRFSKHCRKKERSACPSQPRSGRPASPCLPIASAPPGWSTASRQPDSAAARGGEFHAGKFSTCPAPERPALGGAYHQRNSDRDAALQCGQEIS